MIAPMQQMISLRHWSDFEFALPLKSADGSEPEHDAR